VFITIEVPAAVQLLPYVSPHEAEVFVRFAQLKTDVYLNYTVKMISYLTENKNNRKVLFKSMKVVQVKIIRKRKEVAWRNAGKHDTLNG
jgi:hypothetical protein